MDRTDTAKADPSPQAFQPIVQHDRDGLVEADPDRGEGVADGITVPIELSEGKRRLVFKLDEAFVAARRDLRVQHLTDHPPGFVRRHVLASFRIRQVI